MSTLLRLIRQRRKFVTVALLGYVVVAGGFLMLVRHESGVWQAKRRKLVEESPVVWVAPYGIHYHQEEHYGRHLSSPLSLYEVTERGYEQCNVCHPPSPAKLSDPPVWLRHWAGALVLLSCLWVIVPVRTLYKATGGGIK